MTPEAFARALARLAQDARHESSHPTPAPRPASRLSFGPTKAEMAEREAERLLEEAFR